MTDDVARWRQLGDLFCSLRTLTTHRRGAALDARGIDPSMRAELDALIAADDNACALGLERFLVDAPCASTAPLRIGPWQTIEVIGAGGMGTVWLGERADGAYEQRVAIKIAHERAARPRLGGERKRVIVEAARRMAAARSG